MPLMNGFKKWDRTVQNKPMLSPLQEQMSLMSPLNITGVNVTSFSRVVELFARERVPSSADFISMYNWHSDPDVSVEVYSDIHNALRDIREEGFVDPEQEESYLDVRARVLDLAWYHSHGRRVFETELPDLHFPYEDSVIWDEIWGWMSPHTPQSEEPDSLPMRVHRPSTRGIQPARTLSRFTQQTMTLHDLLSTNTSGSSSNS